MKRHLKIFFITISLIYWGNLDCKADTTDNYQIYIGKALVLTEASFNPLLSTMPILRLDSSNHLEIITINLTHCTSGASDRQLKLSDDLNKTVMAWEFGNKEQKPLMSIPINDILTNTAISNNSSFGLYYMDKEYPAWRLLASVSVKKHEKSKAGKTNSPNKVRFDMLPYIIATLVIAFFAFKTIQQKKVSSN